MRANPVVRGAANPKPLSAHAAAYSQELDYVAETLGLVTRDVLWPYCTCARLAPILLFYPTFYVKANAPVTFFARLSHPPSIMPANLTQQYLKAEEAYRRAGDPQEELDCLQVMLRELPKHKGTDKLQADLKQKISKLRKELSGPRSGASRAGHKLPRQGAGRVVLAGPPNAGKSRLVKAWTRAEPEVAPYPFTTREASPAMMPWEDVSIQLVDTPPVTADFIDPMLLGLIRGADLVLLLADVGQDDGVDGLQECWQRLQQGKTRLARSTRLGRERRWAGLHPRLPGAEQDRLARLPRADRFAGRVLGDRLAAIPGVRRARRRFG